LHVFFFNLRLKTNRHDSENGLCVVFLW